MQYQVEYQEDSGSMLELDGLGGKGYLGQQHNGQKQDDAKMEEYASLLHREPPQYGLVYPRNFSVNWQLLSSPRQKNPGYGDDAWNSL